MEDWRQQFDDLRQRRPGLAARVCRRLLRDLQKKKLVDLDALDELAAALKAGQKKTHDPNRPKPRMTNGSKEELYALALAHADRLYLTEVDDAPPDADTFFPVYTAFATVQASETRHANGLTYRFTLRTRG